MSSTVETQTNPLAYGADSIKILEGLAAVRNTPGMYIGPTDTEGLHKLVFEVLDNSVDEALAGHCRHVDIVIHSDGSLSISDDGRGIPTAAHPDRPNMSTVEVVLTILHAGGKFNKESYTFSGGLHGVGVSVVNALSEWLEAEVRRDGKIHRMRFERGAPTAPLTVTGETRKRGTTIRFKADGLIFETIDFNYDTVANRIRDLAFLNPGLTITIRDERPEGRSYVYRYDGGIVELVRHLNDGRTVIHPEPIFLRKERDVTRVMPNGEERAGKAIVELCLQYNDGFTESVYSYANNINTFNGGTHLTGFRRAFTRTINDYATRNELLKKLKENLTQDDLKEGLTAVLSVKLSHATFDSQVKGRLVSTEVAGIVESIVAECLNEWLEENPKTAKRIVEKCVLAAIGRIEARKARDIIRKDALSITSLPGKLSDCSEKDPARSELFIVEGDSAGGSARQGRDRHYQAILPLRGKILNVERARLDRVFGNEEIRSLITALGCGVGENYDISKLRYGKCIIMTDADVDGAHIRTLLLTFFFRQMRELIERGHVYIAQPPLYKVKKGKTERYLDKDEDKDRMLLDLGLEDGLLYVRTPGLPRARRSEDAPSEPLRKAELRQIVEAVMALESLERQLVRKGLRLQEFLDLRHTPQAQGRLPIGVFTRGGQTEYAYDEDRYTELAEAAEPELEVLTPTATASVEPSQADMLAGDDDLGNTGVDQEQEVRRMFSAMDLRGEAAAVNVAIASVEKLGVSADKFEVDAVEQYKLTDDRALFRYENEGRRIYLHNLRAILESVKEAGKKGITIARYKGLGEMNATELWETTMNPSTRRLILVNLDLAAAAEADSMFATLMGDDVDKRRQFIQRHAPEVRNLDV
jgi:DNA gyrase subunit B